MPTQDTSTGRSRPDLASAIAGASRAAGSLTWPPRLSTAATPSDSTSERTSIAVFCLCKRSLGTSPGAADVDAASRGPGFSTSLAILSAKAYGEDGALRSVADVTSPETLQQVRAYKQSVKAAAKKSGKFTYASAGVGNLQHLHMDALEANRSERVTIVR